MSNRHLLPLPGQSRSARNRLTTAVLLLVLAIPAPGWLKGDNHAEKTAPLVAVVAKQKVQQHQKAIEGIKEALDEKKIKYRFAVYDSSKNLGTVIRLLKIRKPAVIITAGTTPTYKVAEAIPDIPVIYTLILPAGNRPIAPRPIVGATLGVPVETQLRVLKQVIPKAKRIGIIYNPTENGKIVEQAKIIAKENDMELVTFPVNSVKEIPTLEKMNVDTLWLIPDITVCRFPIIKRFVEDGVKLKVPIMAFSPSYAKSGATLAVSYDYRDVGRQSGLLAARLLKGEPYSALSSIRPRKFKLYLNLFVAEKIGLTIPKEIVKQAAEVF